MGVQLLLANHNNAVATADISASSVRPAERTVYRQPTVRQGNGQITLSGGYTGAQDATIELEIRPAAGLAAHVSQPVFSGAGNGTMTPPTAADGTLSQDLQMTLVDVGTATTHAQAVLYGDILLRAKTPGTAGNALSLTVTPQLTLSAAPIGALSAALSKDTAEWTDARLNFGAVPVQPDGTVADTAPRLVFARDTNRVYRHYKRWDGEQWRYGVSPKLSADYAADSLVHTVSGTYTVTVTDGVSTESWSNLITLYDALRALDTSTLVEVVGLIASDRKPGGSAAMDLPVRTAALALPVVASAPARMPDLQNLVIAPIAPTETLTVRCTRNTPVGAETWAVESRVAGALPDARTGVAYSSPFVGFTLPVVHLAQAPMQGAITITQRTYTMAGGSKRPGICLYKPTLGAKASAKTLTLVYTKNRDTNTCGCDAASITGHPNPLYLGLTLSTEEIAAMALPAWYQNRLQTLVGWRSGFIQTNTAITAQGELRTATLDIQLANLASSALNACLAELYAALNDTVPATAALTEWDDTMTALSADLVPLSGVGSETAVSIPVLAVGTTYDAGAVGVANEITINQYDSGALIGVVYTRYNGRHYFRCLVGGTLTGPPVPIEVVNVGHTTLDVGFGNSVWEEITAQDAADLLGRDAANIDHTASPPYDAGLSRTPEAFVGRYQARMDVVRVLVGLIPKSEASSAGSAVWQQRDDPYYWEIQGTGYLPVYTNVYYHSAIRSGEAILPTYEFGVAVRVGCPDQLFEGDSITISINDVSAQYPYQLGDTYAIPLIAGGPLAFAGGITGTDTLTWNVRSSQGTTMPDYALTLAESPYSANGIGFGLHRGRVPFALGDAFAFSIEAGNRFRWRKDAGAWSADMVLTDSAVLTDGLTATFQSGIAPNFVSGDIYRWRVQQPHSPFNVHSAHGEAWHFPGESATLTLTWPTDQTVSVVGLLRHQLATPATLALTLFDAADTPLAILTPTVRTGPLLAVLDAPLAIRKITVTVTNAEGMGLGWLYAGMPFSTRHHAAVALRRQYALQRGQEPNPRGVYLGRGTGGEIRWENWLLQSEFEVLLALLDACKLDGDAPIVLLPHPAHPESAALVRIDTDALDVSDILNFQSRDESARRLSLTLPLAAVLS